MSKTVSSALLTDIQSKVTTLATCLDIVRKDGRSLRLTTHDTDLTVDGSVYKHDVPFRLAAIQSGSQLAVDNTQLTLYADGETITLADVKNGLYEYADVTIFQVNYATPAHGIITMRKGWFGPISLAENNIINITITGLLKILDLEVGRVYQPSCDADLGDSRCKVAIDFNQAHSGLNNFHLGDWTYDYDESLMTAITLVNGDFETAIVAAGLPIAGWTQTTGSRFEVKSSSLAGSGLAVLSGGKSLTGTDDDGGDPHPAGFVSSLWQDVDIIAGGMNTSDIDDGKNYLLYKVALAQGLYLLDPVRIRIELFDSDGEQIDSRDTGWVKFDNFDVWRERTLVMAVKPTGRSVRIWIYMRKDEGLFTNAAADRAKLFFWDHTAGTPYSDVVQHAVRIVAMGADATFYPTNPSFEAQSAVANANGPTITGWTTGAGQWWQTVPSATGLTSQDGSLFLMGGNDGGATQHTYTITSLTPLTTWNLDDARTLLGKYAGRFSLYVGWGDTSSAASVTVDFLDVSNSLVGTYAILSNLTHAVGWAIVTQDFVVPPTATQVKVTLAARSPTGSGNAKVAFDKVQFVVYDTERAKKGDPTSGEGEDGSVLNASPGAYTFDGNVIWKAMAGFVNHDVVSAVVDAQKTFLGTDIAGAAGTYETAAITWLSGDNAGLKNLIRGWNSGTKQLKLYFRSPYPIQVGDRFVYSRTCQRRFLEDCQLTFENELNFRGFPYLPGKLTTP